MQAIHIDEKLKALVQTERKVIAEILKLIQILDITKSYRELGFSSLFNYLTSGLGYSEGAAQRRISSARLVKEIPTLSEDLQSGALNLTQVSLAHSAIQQQEKSGIRIKSEDKYKILQSLKSKNSFETKQTLQRQLPDYDPTPKSVVMPKNENIQILLNFTETEWKDVKEFLTKNSHKIPDQKIESLLLRIARADKTNNEKLLLRSDVTCESVEIKKEVPVEASIACDATSKSTVLLKANQRISKKEVLDSNSQLAVSSLSTLPPLRQRRSAIPAGIRRYVFYKAQNKCQYISPLTRKECRSQHFLEVEHIEPVALGGRNDPGNLRLYCREHNALAAKLAHISS